MENNKQETLEEAFERFMETNFCGQLTKGFVLGAMKFGVKWQQERSYSEEEVLEHLNHLIMIPSSELDKFTDDKEMVTMKWFEQFKKK